MIIRLVNDSPYEKEWWTLSCSGTAGPYHGYTWSWFRRRMLFVAGEISSKQMMEEEIDEQATD